MYPERVSILLIEGIKNPCGTPTNREYITIRDYSILLFVSRKLSLRVLLDSYRFQYPTISLIILFYSIETTDISPSSLANPRGSDI